jgi:hypothetical protein
VTLARATRHQFLTQKLLHDLDDERQSFCSLTVVKMDHGNPTTGRRLESSVTMAVATSGDASPPEMAQAVAVMAGANRLQILMNRGRNRKGEELPYA